MSLPRRLLAMPCSEVDPISMKLSSGSAQKVAVATSSSCVPLATTLTTPTSTICASRARSPRSSSRTAMPLPIPRSPTSSITLKPSSLRAAINARIAAGVPVGGTSAGLAVLGQYIYSAQGDAPDDEGLKSSETLVDPYMPRVTIRRDFLNIDVLRNILTDSHFAKRDRMGRSLTFLARIMKDGWSPAPREIAIDEKSGVLIERDGKSRVIGTGKGAYFISTHQGPEVCRGRTPLTLRDIAVYRAPAGAEFNVKDWKGKRGTSYGLSVVEGKVQSTQAGGEIY